ncbi:MAG: MATE family efflux transporter [Flavobacteriaceae bacterium]|jgi:putative MATE family efflux protein|nr:MATE family efflux transporter [Flavobacteriaceae bacterium]MDA9246615.1 MATE family efflux transporter [bacterium]MBT4314047.1 MATE family efflux transporter [Flavobacteriaceae bacterium]MBT5092150.1 MATE family efflux transporter [Flavobacteriaceae bacterium]MBT5283546.1 MATE family efflux transporter [Flavobacteriaceae bacterium]|tara:strand:- start:30778 stop:32121 length:1344 start_codon:yes stop_codon:yes gene_type:complete
MSKNLTELLGTDSIPKLLVKQALPASIGILVMSLNILIDTIFVGQWIGSNAIAAINVVLPVSFFIAALGMAIGVGGASIISRALGEKNHLKAENTFGNQITLTFLLTIIVVIFGLSFVDQIIVLFGGKGSLFSLAKTYYVIVLYGVPVLAFCMMANNTIRAEGKPKNAMYAMLLPSVSNLFLDYIFINIFDWGMMGAAWATTLSYGVCALYIIYFFLSKKSSLHPTLSSFRLQPLLIKEISSLGSVTLARQAMVSITVLLVNNILFSYGGESSIAVYAIISRMLMFATFPILGITQGFLPIAGYNYGAKNTERVRKVISISIRYSVFLASTIFVFIFFFAENIPGIFSKDTAVALETPNALRYVFAALPIIGIQLIGAAYFQAIGKALPALLLTLSRQGLFFIPLLFILPNFYGVMGVWIAFPVADIFSTLMTAYFLNREIRKQLVA